MSNSKVHYHHDAAGLPVSRIDFLKLNPEKWELKLGQEAMHSTQPTAASTVHELTRGIIKPASSKKRKTIRAPTHPQHIQKWWEQNVWPGPHVYAGAWAKHKMRYNARKKSEMQ